MFSRRQGIGAGAVSGHSRQRGQVTQGTRDVMIPVWIRNKPTVVHLLVTRSVRACPPLASDLSITDTCGQDFVLVEIVIRIHGVPVIPMLIMNTEP